MIHDFKLGHAAVNTFVTGARNPAAVGPDLSFDFKTRPIHSSQQFNPEAGFPVSSVRDSFFPLVVHNVGYILSDIRACWPVNASTPGFGFTFGFEAAGDSTCRQTEGGERERGRRGVIRALTAAHDHLVLSFAFICVFLFCFVIYTFFYEFGCREFVAKSF